MADDLIERLQAAFDAVREWPETRMRDGAVEELGQGFMDLLILRNLAPEVIGELTAERAKVATLTSLVRRWSALDAGVWQVVRHEAEKRELEEATNAALRETGGGDA